MSLVYEERNWNKEHSDCPACNAHDKPKGGTLRIKGKSLICSRYPNCKYSTFIPKKKTKDRKKLLKNIISKKSREEIKRIRNKRKRQLSKLKKWKKKVLVEKGMELKDVKNWKDSTLKELKEMDNHFYQI